MPLRAATTASADSAGRTPTASREATVRPATYDLQRTAHNMARPHSTAEAALSNPNTTRSGRKHAKRELKMMVRLTPASNLL